MHFLTCWQCTNTGETIMIKILMGGSPCTFWSIAQKNGRETEAEGLGWELFKNYLIAKEKFKPDFFLYENNKSAAQPIKDQISRELGVDLMYINSALVSAQTRHRFYAFNWKVEQPEDRGIIVTDVLETTAIRIPEYGAADKSRPLNALYPNNCGGFEHRMFSDKPNKQQVDMIAEPLRVGSLPRPNGELSTSQAKRIYSIDGKSVNLVANGGGEGAKTGLYAIPANDKKEMPIYEVKDGFITIKDKQYPIKLADGFYIIRKLTPIECERLQTLPDGYTRAVSNTQRYKGLGNGWTAEVIIHILNGALKDVPKDEEIIVLSMYDGIGTGRYCLDKMGFTNVKYFAYEIDKYAKQVSMSNYPDIIQMGDAFDLRHPDWTIGY